MVAQNGVVPQVCSSLGLHADEHLFHFFDAFHTSRKLCPANELRLEDKQSKHPEGGDKPSDLAHGVQLFNKGLAHISSVPVTTSFFPFLATQAFAWPIGSPHHARRRQLFQFVSYPHSVLAPVGYI